MLWTLRLVILSKGGSTGMSKQLTQAAATGDYSTVQKIFAAKGFNNKQLVEYKDSDGLTALHHAALHGHVDIVKFLVQFATDINVTDSQEMTPLHHASWGNKPEVIKTLVLKGASVNQLNMAGETAIHMAAKFGNQEALSYLVEYGGDPCLKTKNNESAIDLAAQFGRATTVQYLLSLQRDMGFEILPVPSPDALLPRSPLHSAAANGHLAVVDALIKFGVDVNLKTVSGTALQEAACSRKFDCMRALLEAGAETGLLDEEDMRAKALIPSLQKDGDAADRTQLCKLLVGSEEDAIRLAAGRLNGLVRAQEDEKARLTRNKGGSKRSAQAFGRQDSQDASAALSSPPLSPQSQRPTAVLTTAAALSSAVAAAAGLPSEEVSSATSVAESDRLSLSLSPPTQQQQQQQQQQQLSVPLPQEPALLQGRPASGSTSAVTVAAAGATSAVADDMTLLEGRPASVSQSLSFPGDSNSAALGAPVGDHESDMSFVHVSREDADASSLDETHPSTLESADAGVHATPPLERQSHRQGENTSPNDTPPRSSVIEATNAGGVGDKDERILKEGQLTKRPQRYKKPKFMQGTSSKERWFVLTSSSLDYYQGLSRTGTLKGSIPVSSIRSVEPVAQIDGATFMFEVCHDAGVLACIPKSIQERNAWIEAIRSVSPALADDSGGSASFSKAPKSILARNRKGSRKDSCSSHTSEAPCAEDPPRVEAAGAEMGASLQSETALSTPRAEAAGVSLAPQASGPATEAPSITTQVPPQVAAGEDTRELSHFLEKHRLEQYMSNLTAGGISSVSELLAIHDLDQVLTSLGVSLPGHRRKFIVILDEARGSNALSKEEPSAV